MMRRRDAITGIAHHTHGTRWRKAACLGLSLGFHAGLLAVAALTVLHGSEAVRLIRVSLTSGGGSAGSGEAAAHQGAGSSEAVTQPPQPAPRAQPEPAERRQRLADRPPARARGHAPASQSSQPSAINAVGSATGGSEASRPGVATGSAGGGGDGLGSGSGSGAGDGVDQRMYCVYCPEPHYPLLARTRGWQGSVDVVLVVLADGSVDAASLRRSSGYGVLDQAAVAVARRSRFRPPSASGLSAPLRGRIEYRFELTPTR